MKIRIPIEGTGKHFTLGGNAYLIFKFLQNEARWISLEEILKTHGIQRSSLKVIMSNIRAEIEPHGFFIINRRPGEYRLVKVESVK